MKVAIFGSSFVEPFENDYKVAYDVAYKLSLEGYIIVNGGGKGIMEASSLGANDAGGESIGIVLKSRKLETSFNTKIETCNTLYERLDKLIYNCSAYIFFRGGTGTLAEIGIVWDLVNKELIPKKKIIFYKDYWKPLINLLKNEPAGHGGFASEFVTQVDDIDKIVEIVKATKK